MHALLVGLSPRDASAVSQVIGKRHPDWRCSVHGGGPALPPAEVFVIDIEGCKAALSVGLAACAPALDGRAVVLLAPPLSLNAERARAEKVEADAWDRQGRVVLRRPFGEAGVLSALRRALASARGGPGSGPVPPAEAAPAPAPSSAPATPPAPPAQPSAAARRGAAKAKAEAEAEDRAGPSTVTSSLSSFPPSSVFGGQRLQALEARPPERLPEMGDGSLAVSAFRLAVTHCPLPDSRAFLDGLVRQLATGRPFEMVLTMINGLIFEPQADWVASNTPVAVLRMVARSRALSGLVRYTPIDPRVNPQARATQRGMVIYPLEDLLYVLARLTECPLPAAG